jgi:hypothetical protein
MSNVIRVSKAAAVRFGITATLVELQASKFQQRAALLAAEIAANMPELIALQEVTLWWTGPIMQPPATNILYMGQCTTPGHSRPRTIAHVSPGATRHGDDCGCRFSGKALRSPTPS